MVTVCAWCQKYMGSKEPLHNPDVTHGICGECYEREALDETPVLVVSRDRSGAIPMLQTLLRGAPEIAIVVDRRAAERRDGDGKGNGHGNGHGRPIGYVEDRRTSDRRRPPSFYLV
jgi:hypothetical protein